VTYGITKHITQKYEKNDELALLLLKLATECASIPLML
jgi:hypothetical protein